MALDFKEEEERLRFLVSKIDSEILRFNEIKQALEERKNDFNEMLGSEGMQPVPVKFQPSAVSSENLLDEISQHILELSKLKNFVAQKLNLIIQEDELMQKLRKKHGNAVEIKSLPSGGFELIINDTETRDVFSQLQASKKSTDSLKKTIQELAEK